MSIHTVIIEQGWQEIDTVEDFKNAETALKLGSKTMIKKQFKILLLTIVFGCFNSIASLALAGDPDSLKMVFVPPVKGDESDYEI